MRPAHISYLYIVWAQRIFLRHDMLCTIYPSDTIYLRHDMSASPTWFFINDKFFAFGYWQTLKSMVKCKKCLIEAHLVKSTAGKTLPKRRRKGTGAEAWHLGKCQCWLFGEYPFRCRISLACAESYRILACPTCRGVDEVAFRGCLFSAQSLHRSRQISHSSVLERIQRIQCSYCHIL